MRIRWIFLALLFVGGLSLSVAQTASQPRTALVQIRINRAYDDSEESIRTLDLLLRHVPNRVVTVAPGDTLDSILYAQYGFGKSDLPNSYRLLLASVLQRNNLSQPEKLLAGAFLNLPIIPSRVLMRWGRLNPRNWVANMRSFRALMSVPAAATANRKAAAAAPGEPEPAGIAFRGAPVEKHLDTAPFELLKFELPVEAAEALMTTAEIANVPFVLGGYPIDVRLASEEGCDTEPPERNHATLTAEQRSAISAALRDHSQRSPIVFVLDTGWPGRPAYDESRKTVEDVLSAVWSEKLKSSYRPGPPLATLGAANNRHCRCIERALEELRSLDAGLPAGKRVRVAYVSMTREQDGGALLADLLATNDLLQRQTQSGGVPDDDRIAGSTTWARQFLEALPPRWVGDTVRTDKAVIDAVLGVARAYAEARLTVFFINESWTVDHKGKYKVFYEAPELGIVTSATGNDPTAALQDFALRSSSTNDTMAIMNMSAAGPARDSSLIPSQDLDEAMALGFDGTVTDDINGTSEIHGTSFAAPRVAWFLAAGEAVRHDALYQDRWAIDLKRQLQGMRNPQAAGYDKLLFDPVQYILRQITGPAPWTNE